MSVDDVRELFEGRTSGSDAVSSQSVRVFLVHTTDVADGPEAAEVASFGGVTVPSVGDAHPADADKLARAVEAKPEKNEPCDFRVTVRYTTPIPTPPPEGSDPDMPENPLERTAVVVWGSKKTSIPVERADFRLGEIWISDQPVQSSALEVFDPPAMRDLSRRVLTIVRNEAVFDSIVTDDWEDAVNSDVFMGRPAGTVKVAHIVGSRHYENGVWYWEVEYQFDFKREGWNAHLVDRGTRELGEGTFTTIKDKNGDPVNSPVNLDGCGKVLHPNDPVVYLEYRFYPTQLFEPLGLGE